MKGCAWAGWLSTERKRGSGQTVATRWQRAQEELIREHTLGEIGPYSGMERDNPQRETYLNGVTLRNPLNMAVLGFNVSNLVIGIGVLVVVIGLTNIAVMAPVLFWTRGEAPTAGAIR